MPLSIVTRAYKTSELKDLINNLNSNKDIQKEIVAVCNVNDYSIKNANIIIEDSNRFEARITGINNAIYDKILLIDSDQIPEKGLLTELEDKKNDIIILKYLSGFPYFSYPFYFCHIKMLYTLILKI